MKTISTSFVRAFMTMGIMALILALLTSEVYFPEGKRLLQRPLQIHWEQMLLSIQL